LELQVVFITESSKPCLYIGHSQKVMRHMVLFSLYSVMMLQEGSIIEYNTPQALLDKKGHFYSMAKHARLV